MENIEIYLSKNFPHIDLIDMDIIIEMAKEDILNFCHLNELPAKINNTLLQMCIHKCNVLNDTGMSNTGGVSNIALNFDYPNNIISNLKRFRVLE